MVTGKYFRLGPGDILSDKYRVVSLLGEGWEGEVYLVEELSTGIQRAVKIFFPKRNIKNKVLTQNAKKLHSLRSCPLLIQYLSQEKMSLNGLEVFYMVSDFVQSQTLDDFVKAQPRGFVTQFEALHIIYDLAKGLEIVHSNKDYHGDLHSRNILISRRGLGFDLKLIDFHSQPGSKRELIKEDTIDLINVLYEIVGGQKRYKILKPEVKSIILGRKRSLILKKFPKMSDLRIYMENLKWN